MNESASQKDHCDKLESKARTKGSGLIVLDFFFPFLHIRCDLFHFCVRRQELLSDSYQTLLAATSLPISSSCLSLCLSAAPKLSKLQKQSKADGKERSMVQIQDLPCQPCNHMIMAFDCCYQ